MGVIVCKFGGTSTANADMFQRIRDIIGQNDARRYIVLSAPGAEGASEKVTDLLYRCWRVARAGGDPAPLIGAVVARFRSLTDGLGLPDKDEVARRAILRGLSLSEAHTVSRGEYLCARVFSGFTGMPMADAAGLVAFDRSGRLDTGRTLRGFRELASRLPCAVIPGFYGSDPDGNIVTFPRNGSDITGALAAWGVGAALYENWTDVPGLMTADPASDPDARLIPSVSYREMRRLSERGARVLHPDCLDPVARAGIPTRIKSTANPEAPGTLISE